jgi:hypothetical protein
LKTGENTSKKLLELIEVGINHEQQHQELLAYDIKIHSQSTYFSGL